MSVSGYFSFSWIHVFQGLIEWLEKHSRPCFYKKHFGFECPGCGFQRAVIELLQGNLTESFKQYPALIPLILLFSFLVLHLIFKFKHGAWIIKLLFITCIILILINFIYKLTLKN